MGNKASRLKEIYTAAFYKEIYIASSYPKILPIWHARLWQSKKKFFTPEQQSKLPPVLCPDMPVENLSDYLETEKASTRGERFLFVPLFIEGRWLSIVMYIDGDGHLASVACCGLDVPSVRLTQRLKGFIQRAYPEFDREIHVYIGLYQKNISLGGGMVLAIENGIQLFLRACYGQSHPIVETLCTDEKINDLKAVQAGARLAYSEVSARAFDVAIQWMLLLSEGVGVSSRDYSRLSLVNRLSYSRVVSSSAFLSCITRYYLKRLIVLSDWIDSGNEYLMYDSWFSTQFSRLMYSGGYLAPSSRIFEEDRCADVVLKEKYKAIVSRKKQEGFASCSSEILQRFPEDVTRLVEPEDFESERLIFENGCGLLESEDGFWFFLVVVDESNILWMKRGLLKSHEIDNIVITFGYTYSINKDGSLYCFPRCSFYSIETSPSIVKIYFHDDMKVDSVVETHNVLFIFTRDATTYYGQFGENHTLIEMAGVQEPAGIIKYSKLHRAIYRLRVKGDESAAFDSVLSFSVSELELFLLKLRENDAKFLNESAFKAYCEARGFVIIEAEAKMLGKGKEEAVARGPGLFSAPSATRKGKEEAQALQYDPAVNWLVKLKKFKIQNDIGEAPALIAARAPSA